MTLQLISFQNTVFLMFGLIEKKLVSHTAVLVLIFRETFMLFTLVNVQIYHPTHRIPFSPHPHQHLFFVVIFTIVILTGVR